MGVNKCNSTCKQKWTKDFHLFLINDLVFEIADIEGGGGAQFNVYQALSPLNGLSYSFLFLLQTWICARPSRVKTTEPVLI